MKNLLLILVMTCMSLTVIAQSPNDVTDFMLGYNTPTEATPTEATPTQTVPVPDCDAAIFITDIVDEKHDGYTFTHATDIFFDTQTLTPIQIVTILENYIEWYKETQLGIKKI